MFLFRIKKNKDKEKNRVVKKDNNFNFSFLNNSIVEDNDTYETEIDKKKKSEKFSKLSKFKNNLFVYILFLFILLIFGYLIFSYFRARFNKRVKIESYEVTSGEIINYSSETGFIFRNEEVFSANETGFINFMNLSNTRISKNSLIYIINDENKYSLSNVEYTDKDYQTILNTAKNFINNYNDLYFQYTYNYNKSLNYLLSELRLVDNLSSITENSEIEVKSVGYAQKSGIISYFLDGYENRLESEFTQNFINLNDNINIQDQSSFVKQGQNIFKIVNSPDYDIVFSSKYNYDNLINKHITINFKYDNLTSDAFLSEFYGSDGNKYYKVTLNRYLERYLDRRIIEFEIVNKSISGLKIPNSAITLKNCYRIPKSYLYTNDFDEDVFHKSDKNGNIVEVSVNISKSDENFYYVSTSDVLSQFEYGDILVNDNNSLYPLNNIIQLPGVYNINKGYCAFKNVEILDQTNEFTIISQNTPRGITIYDHIALDSKNVNDGDMI